MVLQKTLESPLDCKEIKPVNPKGNQPWKFIGRTDAKTEAPILWPPDAKSWLTGKKPWCWERLRAGRKGSDRGWDGWMVSLTQWTWVLSELQEIAKDREAWHTEVHGVAKSWTWLNNSLLIQSCHPQSFTEGLLWVGTVLGAGHIPVGETNQIPILTELKFYWGHNPQ